MNPVTRYLLSDLLKNKVVIGYFLIQVLIGWGIFLIQGTPEKAFFIILQVSLFFLPLMTMVFTSIYFYNSNEFIELLLSQPVSRNRIFYGFTISLNLVFIAGYFTGICLPLLIYYTGTACLFLIAGGILLITIFSSLSLMLSTAIRDKTKGLGLTLLIWAFYAFIFDGILLLIMYNFSEYPIEGLILSLSFLNPIDIARILVIMQTDAAAIIGLSGAVCQDFFGSFLGSMVSLFILLAWFVLVLIVGKRIFLKKDF
jgi:Cu-processing system permease protein